MSVSEFSEGPGMSLEPLKRVALERTLIILPPCGNEAATLTASTLLPRERSYCDHLVVALLPGAVQSPLRRAE